jgi:N-acetyl-gamma-glutamylphosphate reductase
MLTSISFPIKKGTTTESLEKEYQKFYHNEAAVRVLTGDALPETKRVMGRHGAQFGWMSGQGGPWWWWRLII